MPRLKSETVSRGESSDRSLRNPGRNTTPAPSIRSSSNKISKKSVPSCATVEVLLHIDVMGMLAHKIQPDKGGFLLFLGLARSKNRHKRRTMTRCQDQLEMLMLPEQSSRLERLYSIMPADDAGPALSRRNVFLSEGRKVTGKRINIDTATESRKRRARSAWKKLPQGLITN